MLSELAVGLWRFVPCPWLTGQGLVFAERLVGVFGLEARLMWDTFPAVSIFQGAGYNEN